MCEWLLQQGANINSLGEAGNSLLTRSAFDGRLEVCRFVLDNGGALGHKQANGENAVLIATKFDHHKLAALLLERTKALGDADNRGIDEPDDCGRTGLMFGCMMNKMASVKFCVENGTNVDAQDHWGSTPLMFAVRHPKGGLIVDLLLSLACEVNLVDKTFRSALHYAMRAGQMATISKLLEAGADPSFLDDDDKTPLELLLNPAANLTNVQTAITVMSHLVKVLQT